MRSGPVGTLGPFGAAAAWLLRTESPELALIIGLLGFGFFGALAASFIREFAGTPRNELPAIGFILPALIRGVGAAILVFLLAKGGTAILPTGDASPNAYAIFFACFVAAVFSKDVWSWACSRQRRQFAEEKAEAEPSENLPAEPKRDSNRKHGPLTPVPRALLCVEVDCATPLWPLSPQWASRKMICRGRRRLRAAQRAPSRTEGSRGRSSRACA